VIAQIGVVREPFRFAFGLLRDFAPDGDQLTVLRKRQWPEQNSIDHAEDGAVCAKTESEREHRSKRESG
jgi:hypothetical protein